MIFRIIIILPQCMAVAGQAVNIKDDMLKGKGMELQCETCVCVCMRVRVCVCVCMSVCVCASE